MTDATPDSQTTTAESAQARPLLKNDSFWWLWVGEGISQLGAQFSGLALPVLAVAVLGATEWQVGVLNAAETLAFLVVGLPAGAWIDRLLKRRVMIVADLVRVVALAAVPILFFADALQIWHLYIVGLVVGVATVFFDVSYQSFIPVLLPSEQIGSANSKLEATAQVAHVAGPGLAGGLLAVVSAPLLLLADAASYLVSAFALWRVKDTEVLGDPADRQSLPKEIAEGLRFVFAHQLLRRITLTTSTLNFFGTLATTLMTILILRTLGLSPATLGFVFSVGAIGGLLGAIATPWFTKWLGEGTSISVSALGSALAAAALPLSAVFPQFAIPILIVGEFIFTFLVLVYNITQVTMRQRLTPQRLLGRMNASIRFIVWGVLPIASLLSGLLGTAIGILPTMWIGVVGGVLGSGFALFSPLTGMRELPKDQLPDGAASEQETLETVVAETLEDPGHEPNNKLD